MQRQLLCSLNKNINQYLRFILKKVIYSFQGASTCFTNITPGCISARSNIIFTRNFDPNKHLFLQFNVSLYRKEFFAFRTEKRRTCIGSTKSSFISTSRLNVITVGLTTGEGCNEKSFSTIVFLLSSPQLAAV